MIWLLLTYGMVCGIAVSLLYVIRTKNQTIDQLTSFARGQTEEIWRLQEGLRRAIELVARMQRAGFVSLPPDDEFDTYSITPEHEADIEAARAGRSFIGHEISPEELVGE